tara:strand:- start:1263 stop:1679 length:417 start_codon:yes stop_codon:yes gene_type:complete
MHQFKMNYIDKKENSEISNPKNSNTTDSSDSSDSLVNLSLSKESKESNKPSRSVQVKTYVLSIPIDHKLNKKLFKNASIRKLHIDDDVYAISKHIEDIEKNIVNNIKNVKNVKNVNFSFTNCCNSLSCLANNETDVKL